MNEQRRNVPCELVETIIVIITTTSSSLLDDVMLHLFQQPTRHPAVILEYLKCEQLYLYLLWSPYGTGQTIIFSCCGLFFLSSSFFPRLISAAADWMSAILPHMVWP